MFPTACRQPTTLFVMGLTESGKKWGQRLHHDHGKNRLDQAHIWWAFLWKCSAASSRHGETRYFAPSSRLVHLPKSMKIHRCWSSANERQESFVIITMCLGSMWKIWLEWDQDLTDPIDLEVKLMNGKREREGIKKKITTLCSGGGVISTFSSLSLW